MKRELRALATAARPAAPADRTLSARTSRAGRALRRPSEWWRGTPATDEPASKRPRTLDISLLCTSPRRTRNVARPATLSPVTASPPVRAHKSKPLRARKSAGGKRKDGAEGKEKEPRCDATAEPGSPCRPEGVTSAFEKEMQAIVVTGKPVCATPVKPANTAPEKPKCTTSRKLECAAPGRPVQAKLDDTDRAVAKNPTPGALEKFARAAPKKPTGASPLKPSCAPPKNPTRASLKRHAGASSKRYVDVSSKKPDFAAADKLDHTVPGKSTSTIPEKPNHLISDEPDRTVSRKHARAEPKKPDRAVQSADSVQVAVKGAKLASGNPANRTPRRAAMRVRRADLVAEKDACSESRNAQLRTGRKARPSTASDASDENTSCTTWCEDEGTDAEKTVAGKDEGTVPKSAAMAVFDQVH